MVARERWVWRCCGVLALVIALLGALAWQPRTAAAATLQVTKLADTNDGACNADCSLREAIAAAAAGDTITFAPAVTGTIALTGGELVIARDLRINGPGASALAISGNNTGRVFHLTAGNVTIENLTVRNARGAANGFGGGIYNERANFTLRDSVVTNNAAAYGAGIFAQSGTTTIDRSTISNNSTLNIGGSGGGGGVESYFTTLTVTNSTISGNQSSYGGGLYIVGGTATIEGTTIVGNSGGIGGGGINIENGALTIANSTISNNGAGFGGGIEASGDFGNPAARTLFLKNVTMADNNGITRGDDISAVSITINSANTIFGSLVYGPNTCYSFSVIFSSGGHNIDRDGTCGLTGTGDLPNTDPRLAALGDYGGPTQTHALQVGSPAIGAGNQIGCGIPPLGDRDQRGVGRPQGSGCDIGAYEAGPLPSLAVGAAAGTYGGMVNLAATLTNAGGGALSGKQVCFTLNGTSAGCASTDPMGTARINSVGLGNINAGTYASGVGATFASDLTTGPASGNNSLAVDKATLTVTAQDKSRAYGDPNPAFTATYSGFRNGQTLGNSGVTGTPSLTTTATATSPVGGSPYPIAAAIGTLAATNYSFTFANGSLTITRATLTVSAEDKSRAYGDANPGLTAAFGGFKNGESLATSGVTGAPGLSTMATPTSSVSGGPYPIVVAQGTLAANNYSFSFVNGRLTITPASLTVTADDATRAYGVANPGFTVSYSGFMNGESAATALSGTPAIGTATTAASPVGQYPITVAQGTLAANNGNYSFLFGDGTLTIARANLTVTVDDASRVYSAPNPAFTVTFGGFANGDTAAVIGGAPAFSTVAIPTSPVGNYPVNAALGTLSATNYTFGPFVGGTLTVTKVGTALTQVSGAMIYADTGGSVTATLRRTAGDGGPVVGATVRFAVDGAAVCGATGLPACPTTDTRGVAIATVPLYPGTPIGSRPGTVRASYAGGTNDTASEGTGPLTVAPLGCAGRFADVPDTDPACPAIAALTDCGVIAGYATTPPTFGPDDDVQRAQIAAFLVRALGWETRPTGPRDFPDFDGLVKELQDASRILANACDSQGQCVIRGYTNGRFGPTDGVTHAQVIALIARAFALDPTYAWAAAPGGAQPYTGVPAVHDGDVRTYVANAGAIPDAPDTAAGWNAPATRAWVARVIWQAVLSSP